ncbi:MAG: metallophosphatase family protein [Sphingobacteriales bacterium]|jgi:putative phosphoesterase|nr:metallophosphatase family protein [Sphingobacteriales bacterium]
MIKIGLLSDTHSHFPDEVYKYFAEVDEIWHAGDVGNMEVIEKLKAFKPLRAVYGNIDGQEMRKKYPLDVTIELEGLRIWMTHIGGYPGKYADRIRKSLEITRPGLFISGHSHILKVIPDKKLNLLHLNPGSAGKEGFHQVRTMMRFAIEAGKIKDLEVIELGPRAIQTKL